MSTLVGMKAADFRTPAVMPDNSFNFQFNLMEHLKGSMGVLFFYAMDFSYVCPTELLAIQNRLSQFEERNVKVVAISIDSHLSHKSWRNTAPEKGGVGQLGFPLISDITKKISKEYGVLITDSFALRGTFIIDQEGYIRHQSINDISYGRNIDEIIRNIDMIQQYEQKAGLYPAGWSKGQRHLAANDDDLQDYMAECATNL